MTTTMRTRRRTAQSFAGMLVFGMSNPGIAVACLPLQPSGCAEVAIGQTNIRDQDAFLSQFEGTYLPFDAQHFLESTGGVLADDIVVELRTIEEVEAKRSDYSTRSPEEIIAAIRSALSLQVKELAEILRVERPTVYSWIKGSAFPSRHNATRLRQVFRLAERWNRLSSKPVGKSVREMGPSEQSILDVLKQDTIQEDDVMQRFHAVASARTADQPKQKSIREVAAQHDFDLSRVREQRDNLDVLTGKRPHQD